LAQNLFFVTENFKKKHTNHMKDGVKYIAVILLAALVGGITAAIVTGFQSNDVNVPVSNDEHTQMASYEIKTVNVPNFDFVDVAELVTPTVVHIHTKGERREERTERRHPFEEFFGDRFDFDQFRPPRSGVGSGVIISENGYIVTNMHVIRNAAEIEVVLDDNRKFSAEVIGQDRYTDLAVLKIDATGLQSLGFGDSDQLRIGEWVLAVGNPFNLRSTVTAGIVSAKARNIQLLGGGASIESFIQTDAAVNPGNSGGALVNTQGELVGINTAIATQTGQYAGYSFAVPVNIVAKVAEDIIEFGEVQRGFIGVNIRDVDADLAEEIGLELISGVLVEGLSDGGAAEDAGIESGDVIIKVNERKIASVPELQEYVSLHRPGDEITVTVIRNGRERHFDLVLRTRDGRTQFVSETRERIKELLGAEFSTLSEAGKDQFEITHGVVVESLSDGKLREAGVPEGFVITRIDNRNIYTPADVFRVFQNKEEGGVLLEGINPNGSRGFYGFGLE
jgi:serine protease Do